MIKFVLNNYYNWIKMFLHLIYNFIEGMSQLQKQQQTNIFDIVDKSYEHRSASQHKFLTDFMVNIFSTISERMARLITFYLQRVPGPVVLTNKQFSSQSFVITGAYSDMDVQNPQVQYKISHISRDKKVSIEDGHQGIVLDYAHYVNCQSLGQSSVQQQISFMHSSQFLCSIPKRRLYHILRKATILKFSFNQNIYIQGQQIQSGESGSGVYLVRKGDFGYFKQSQRQNKQIQALGFTKGHLFGTIQISNKSGTIQNRQFTVRCKSHSGLVFRISEQIFNAQIKPYCQNVINSRQSKLMKFIDSHLVKLQKTRELNAPLLSNTMTRGFSTSGQGFMKTDNDFPMLGRTRLSVPMVDKSLLKPTLSQRMQQQGLRKTNYLSLTKQGPLKAYPMISQRSNFTQSQFRQFNRLERNKEMCQKIKQLRSKGKCTAAKGQILFSFFKQTWNFEKQKKLMFHNKRYA